jgi:alkyl sulfatase BDS1-like metallo-beta-lactamase superfamily hydrolase
MPNVMERFAAARGKAVEEAGFYWSGGPIEVAPRSWFLSEFSGVTAFETDDGIVLIDSGLQALAPLLARRLRQKTQAPIDTAIFTHGHIDHAYGLEAFLLPGQKRPRIVAQRAILDRFTRYERMAGFNTGVNARQFSGQPGTLRSQAFQPPSLMPDLLFDERLSLSAGGVAFELFHCRGETDDGCWVWCPERKVVATGDLIINAVPNAGNPQKVQRYPWDWADGLRAIAACAAVSLCPGHGGPIVQDGAKVRQLLLDTADYLDSIVSQTLAALNDGAPPHVDIVHRVIPPSTAAPWLQPIYDEAEFIVRNVIRFFGGWWGGRPSELKPAPRKALARELASLSGGAGALLERAQSLAAAGDLRLACHLADFALEATPKDVKIRDGVGALYQLRAARESSLIAANLFSAAAISARQGQPFD